MKNYPTPYAEVNVVVQAVLDGGRVILGDHFIGMYLGGSLAAGDFDTASDVDVYVQVTTIADAGTSMVNLPNTM